MDKRYSLLTLSRRLFGIAASEKKLLTISTLASIVGNFAHIGLMAFGASLILFCAGKIETGSAALWAALILISVVAIVSCRYLEGYASHAGAYRLLADMRVKMFETLRRLAPACMADRNKGDILSIAVSDIETVEFFFAHTIGPLFTVILLPCFTLIFAWIQRPIYAIALLPIYAIVSGLLPLISMKTGRGIGRDSRKYAGELKSLVLESVYGLKDVQIFGCGERRICSVINTTKKINRTAHLQTIHRQLVTSAPSFFIYLARIAIVAIASFAALSGQDDPSRVIILSFVVSASFSSTQSLTMVISSLLDTYAAAERLFTIEDTVPEVIESENPVGLNEITAIEFRNVSFGYASESPHILKHMQLSINKGDKIGIMGESGIGKSTILRLLLRFWETDAGDIFINGIPIREISLNDLYGRIGFLEQDTFIFNDTIAANISLGRPDAEHEEIVRAAKRAGIHDLILTLPDGYDTQMGEMSNRLSGGEKQRIGIARIMLTDPDVLVMDEPTSNLDVLNEKGLLNTLENEYSDKTIIVVSHRLSTFTGCTRIFRLENGRLFDLGVSL